MAKFVTVYKILLLFFVLQFFFKYSKAKRLRRVRRGWLSSGKPTGVKCALNPCSVPGFCGTGRTCEMDENCRHHCECDQGSTHELCAEDALAQTATPKPMKCTFNPCSSSAFACDGGRKCVLDDFCMPECACMDGSKHPSCLDRTETPTKRTVEETTGVDKCKTGEIPCIHGHCARDGDQYMCECDKGWGGDTCNESKCTMQCPKGFYCHFVTSSVQICLESIPEETTVSTMLPTPTTKTSLIANVCNESYTARDSEEQKCPSGTACKYGVCINNGDEERCKCDAGSSGTLCEYKCCRECGEFGTCVFDEELGETCSCNVNYTGVNCTDLKSELTEATPAPPEEVTWHYWVVGACAVLLLILITLMVVVPYIMWRNRVILVMKVVHYFQGYEDDDDRQWDAFISYKSNKADEHFVVKTLFPKLEKEMGFKVNVHFRDFVPGETIANNIISAVQSSRRTIMIITPSYVTSEFTKFEYQVAQQEMLKRKHRIIPILFDDISECKETMDPNLKVILDSVTYIEWPKDGNEKKLAKFWKRMELSLPKIKNRSVEADNTKSQTNGTVTMTKPEDINISLSNEKRKSKTDIQNTKIYTMIDENKLDPEEVYDTLNESEMQSKVIAKKADSNHNGHVNVLKVDV
ncbi:uncharacterized protein LOC123524762 isoform X2 [Mercenaria mercenaria]|uniref:uncharacterized protein LOC123524762 isoform X2 n=1 Tax=Mercenaria mercenaria TaxID=6596 RepID=UPI00234F80E8|nr:uncharacterized protein LOC123524762 isoform X2 [Mercenaria mercenaria]